MPVASRRPSSSLKDNNSGARSERKLVEETSVRLITGLVGSGMHFMYQGIFDTDFDKYLEDAVALFVKTGITTVLVNLEGWPEDWKPNLPAVIKFFRDHQCSSFLEYGEYPYVSADEIKKALKLKSAFSGMLDLMQ